jgi:hypothetical protein
VALVDVQLAQLGGGGWGDWSWPWGVAAQVVAAQRLVHLAGADLVAGGDLGGGEPLVQVQLAQLLRRDGSGPRGRAADAALWSHALTVGRVTP